MAKWAIVLLFALPVFGQEQAKRAELSVLPDFLFADGAVERTILTRKRNWRSMLSQTWSATRPTLSIACSQYRNCW